jgi:7-keto-8-aminopelargonate synthetase-like enzyme
MTASRRLLDEHSIWIPAIRPPTVKRPILRLIITASHTREEIDELIMALDKVLGER